MVLLRFVRRLQYYEGARLLVSLHHRLRLLAFPMRTVVLSTSQPDTRSPSFRCDPLHVMWLCRHHDWDRAGCILKGIGTWRLWSRQ
jgi:hypothetical protein